MTGIPSIIFTASRDELPASVETCWDVAQLAQKKIDAGQARQTAFENQWQRIILGRARAICPAPALDHLVEEVRILTGLEIINATSDLARLRSFFLSDITVFSQLGLDNHNPFRKLSEQEIYESALRAESRLSANDDDYSTLAEAFFSFLASQQELLQAAAAAGLLVVHTQFHG